MSESIEVDNIIEQLLSVRGGRPGRQVNLTEEEIRWLCVTSKDIFSQQPALLELEAPIKICGECSVSAVSFPLVLFLLIHFCVVTSFCLLILLLIVCLFVVFD